MVSLRTEASVVPFHRTVVTIEVERDPFSLEGIYNENFLDFHSYSRILRGDLILNTEQR